MITPNNIIGLSPYNRKTQLLLMMLASISKQIVPIGNTPEVDAWLSLNIERHSFDFDKLDNSTPILAGQNKSFAKLYLGIPSVEGIPWFAPTRLVIFLVDFEDGIIPHDYQLRIYEDGVGHLTSLLTMTGLFDEIFNTISRAVAKANIVSSIDVEKYSLTAQTLQLSK